MYLSGSPWLVLLVAVKCTSFSHIFLSCSSSIITGVGVGVGVCVHACVLLQTVSMSVLSVSVCESVRKHFADAF